MTYDIVIVGGGPAGLSAALTLGIARKRVLPYPPGDRHDRRDAPDRRFPGGVDPAWRETSVPGIYAAGDLSSRQQAAIFAAAAGTHSAAMLNLELTSELVLSGVL